MSKEVMNPGVGFTLPPEDTYNYKIPDKSGVNDEPEVSGDYYILFKDKLSELKRAITDPEILIEYHMHNLVYANSLPKIEEQLGKKLEYIKDPLYNFNYYNENMTYVPEMSENGYFTKKGLRYPTFMIPYNQNSTPIRFYVDVYKTDNSGNVIEHVIKNPFDTLRDDGGTPEELKELQDHMSNLIINADQYTSPLKMLAYEFDDKQSNPNRIGIYFDSFASNGNQNYSDILYVGLFFDGFTYATDSNYVVEIKYSIDKKYELIGEPVIVGGKEVYRIRALKDFGDVKIGDIGGFVESEENLSQFGTCWLYNESKAIDKAKIVDDAKVYGTTIVMDSASISNNATIGVKDFIVKPYIKKDNDLYTNSIFKSQFHGTPMTHLRDYFEITAKTDNANSYLQHIKNLNNRFEDHIVTDIIISGKAIIKNNAKILLDTRISGNAIVKDNAIVGSPIEIDEEMHVNAKWDKYETAIIYVEKSEDGQGSGAGQTAVGPYGYDKTPYKYTDITDSAIIAENAYVRGKVTGTSVIKGTSYIHKHNQIQGNTTISDNCVLLNGFLQYNYNIIHNSKLSGSKFISADTAFIDTTVKSDDFESFHTLFSQSYMLGDKYVVGPDTITEMLRKVDTGEYMWYNSDAKFIRCKSIEGSSIIFDFKEDRNNRPEFYDCVFEGSNILDPIQIKANVDNSYNLLTVSATNTTKYYTWLAELDNLIQAKTNTTYLNYPYFAKLCRMRFKNGILTTAMKYMIDYGDSITVNPRQIDINNTSWYVPQQNYQLASFPVYRIIATENFGNITKGTKGGYVQSYANLSIYNESWIESGSTVALKAHVTDNAKVKGSSNLIGDCVIADSAEVFQTTIVGGATMTGTVTSGDGNTSNSSVYIGGAAMVYYALLQGDVTIVDQAVIQGRGVSNKMVYSPYYGYTPDWTSARNGSLIMRDNSQILGNVKIHCTSHIEMHNRATVDSNNGETTFIGGSLELYMHDTTRITNRGTNNSDNMASAITGLNNLISRGEISIYDDQTKMFRNPHDSYQLTPSGGATFIAMYDNSSIDMTMSQITYGTNLIMTGQTSLTMNRAMMNETSLEMNQFTKVNMKGSNAYRITPTTVHDVTPVGCQFISSNIILNDTSYIDMDEDRMEVYADLANTRKITTCILAGANVTLNHASYLRDAVITTEGWFAGDQNELSWHYMYSTMCNKSIYGSADPTQATKFSEKLDYNTTPTLVLTQRACMDNVYMGKFSHKPTSDFIKSNVGVVDQNLLNIGDVVITLFGDVHFDPRTHLNVVNFDSHSLPVQYFTPDITQNGLLKGYIESAFEKPAGKNILGDEKAIMYYIGNYKKQTDGRVNPRYYLSTTVAPRPFSDALSLMSPRWRYNKYYRQLNVTPIYIAELYRMFQKKNDDNDYIDYSNTMVKADATLPNSFFSHFGESSGDECLLDLENYYGLIFNNTYIESTKFTYDSLLSLGSVGTPTAMNNNTLGIVNNVFMNGLDYKTKSKIFYLPKDVKIKNKTVNYSWTPTTIMNLSNYADQFLLENLSMGINSGGTAINNGDGNYLSTGKNIIYEPSPLFRQYGKQFTFKHKRVFSTGTTPSPFLDKARQLIYEMNIFPTLESSLLPPAGEFGVTNPTKRTKRDHYIYVHANVIYNTIFNVTDYDAIAIDKDTMDGAAVSGYDVNTKTTIDGYYKNVLAELKTGTRMNLVSVGTLDQLNNIQHGPRFQYPIIIGHTSMSDDFNMLYKRPYIMNSRLHFTTDATKYVNLGINRYSPPSTLPVGFYADVVDADNPIPRITQLHRFLNTPQIYGTFTIYNDKTLNTLIENKSTLWVSDFNDSVSSALPFVKEQESLYDNYRYYLYRYGSQQTGSNIHFRKDISLFKNNIKKMEWFSGYINEMMMIGFAFDGFEVINGLGYAPFKAISPKCIKTGSNSVETISIMGQVGTTVSTVHSKVIYYQAIDYNLFDKEVYARDNSKRGAYLFSAERNTPYANINTRYESVPEAYIPYTNNIFKSGIIFSYRYPSDIKIMGDSISIIGLNPLTTTTSDGYFQPFDGWKGQIEKYHTDMAIGIPNEPETKFSGYLGMNYRRSERNVSENLDVLMTDYNLNNIFPLYTKDLNYTYDHVNGFKIMGSKYDHLSFKQLYEDNIYNNSKYDRARVYLHQDLNTISYPDRSEYPPDAPISYITTATNANEYFDVSYFGLPTQLDLVGASTYNEVELSADAGYYMYPKTMTKYSLMNIANGYSGLNATTDLSKIHSSNPAYNQYQGSITGTKLLNPYMYAMRQSDASNALGIYFVNNYVSKTSFPYGFKYNETAYHEFKNWNLYSSGSGQREYLYVQTMLPLEDENGTYTEVHDTFENKTNGETFIYNNKKVTTYAPSSYRYYYYGMYKD